MRHVRGETGSPLNREEVVPRAVPFDTSELKYHWARHIFDVETRAVPMHKACFLCHAGSGQYGRVGQGSDGWGSPRDTDVTEPLACSPPNRARPPPSGIQVVAEATAVPAPECGGGAVAPELRPSG